MPDSLVLASAPADGSPRDGYGAAATSEATAEQPPLRLPVAIWALLRCAAHTVSLLTQRRVRQPAGNVGRRVWFADGTSATVYRETVIQRAPPADPTVVVVGFRLRKVRSD